jgi:beta-galactosidase
MKTHLIGIYTSSLAILAAGLAGCSSKTQTVEHGTGGKIGTGGVASSGGTTGSGGAMGTGGTKGIGGAKGTGGATRTGGASSSGRTGGVPSSGGVGTGGMNVSGGSTGTNDGGSRDVGPSGTGGGGAAATGKQAYDGARGKLFCDGWRFFRGDATGAQDPAFNDSSWRSLKVPHDWSIELAFNRNSPAGGGGGYLDGGVGWYRKSFTLDESYASQRILIEFDGAYMNSQVWINGTSLGTRPYGYSTFQYDLTPYVKFGGGNNVIAVKVNNNQPNSRWYSGSGIYRNVWLTVLPAVHIAYGGVFITTPSVSATSAMISVATDVENKSSSSQSVKVTAGIYDAEGALVVGGTTATSDVAANAMSSLTQSLSVSNPKLWSPDSPNLYQVKVELQLGGATLDTYLSPLGLRWFNFSATSGFSLNDKTIKLRGVCNHHDLGALGAAFNDRALERQMQILKAMGVNALRTSHNPPVPELLEIADRLGIMVMDEAFDCWETGKTSNDYHLYFNQWAETDIKDLIRRDRNHPSVIVWSIGNEIPSPSATTGTKLRNWVRELDSTRPVTWASNKMGDSSHQAVAAVLDLQGYNYSQGSYDGDHAAHSNWKMYGSETSSAVRSRGIYHAPASQSILTSSDTQCSSYDNSVVSWGASAESSYSADLSRSYMAGQFIWTGFDYIGEPTPYETTWPAKSSYFGIVDTAGFPKDIYYFYQSRWTTSPMVHILPHWNWTAGTTVTVYVYSNCDSVELFLNDVSQGSKTFSSSTLHATWSVPWASGTLRAEGKRGGGVVASEEVKTAGQPAQIKLSADRTTIQADGRDLAFITTDIQDANGVFAAAATNSVTFAVSGPGKIVGVDNGNAADTTIYTSLTRNAFSGKVLAIVQSTGDPGQITVSATSSGLAAGSVSTTAM